ncbi:MAG: hypothetical protein Q4G62_07525, partial [Pseudomonadota bacterium]|nr:hypothetical protein [Pseudomonadota bacterium]
MKKTSHTLSAQKRTDKTVAITKGECGPGGVDKGPPPRRWLPILVSLCLSLPWLATISACKRTPRDPDKLYYGTLGPKVVRVRDGDIFLTDYEINTQRQRGECTRPLTSIMFVLHWPDMEAPNERNMDDFTANYLKSVGDTQWVEIGLVKTSVSHMKMSVLQSASLMDHDVYRSQFPAGVERIYGESPDLGLKFAIIDKKYYGSMGLGKIIYSDSWEGEPGTSISCDHGPPPPPFFEQLPPPKWTPLCKQFVAYSELPGMKIKAIY